MDIRELESDKELLSDFLRSKLKIDITASENELLIDSDNLSPKELKRFVNKFVYHRSLMNKYWVALTDNVVKIKKSKYSKKHEKKKEKGLFLQRLSTVGRSMLSMLKSIIIQPF